jgi:23S rRNA (uracil1939-C5)-methyltransferase
VADIVTIGMLGHRGDGIVHGPDGPAYVPFTLPGERVSITREGDRGKLIDIIEPSSQRIAPVCRHFGLCGGCALQMLPLKAARSLKRDFVVAALKQHGLSPPVDETLGVGLASRRRAVLTALRLGERVVLGYHERLSHRLVDIEECPVLAPSISVKLTGMRQLLSPLLPQRRPVRVTVLATCNGLDLALEDVPAPPASRLAKLAAAAKTVGIARLSVAGEPILTLAEPSIEIASVPVVPPPGAFVQASSEAETIIAELVSEHLRDSRRVSDLFSGVGTFTLSLARQASVHAVEDNQVALDALSQAARRAAGLKPITTERRDLMRHPLSPQELDTYDAIVFDPPRNGAKTQAAQLAASKVERIAAVSCNPATFARDARILVDGGYQLDRVVPVDQFVYSAETEVVGLFRRS